MFDDIQTAPAARFDDDTTGLLDPAFDDLFEDTFSHIAGIDAAMDVIIVASGQ